MTAIGRPRGTGLGSSSKKQGALGDRNVALLIVTLVLTVTLGPFLLVHRSPVADADEPASYGGARSGRTTSDLAAARARRDGYRQISSRTSKMKVYVYPDIDAVENEGRLLRFLNDGVKASHRFELTDIPEGDNTVWLVDLTKAKCKDLVSHVQEILGRRMTAVRNRFHPSNGEAGGAEDDAAAIFKSDILWPIYVMDFSDYGYVLDDDSFYNINDLTTDCIRPLSDLLGKRNTFFASRQHVSGREIEYENEEDELKGEDELIGELGEPIDYNKLFCANFMSGTVRQIHYGMRDVMNEGLLRAARWYASKGGVSSQKEEVDPSSIARHLDVAYFWKIGDDDIRTGEHRDHVRDALLEMKETGEGRSGSKKGLKVHADPVAEGLGSIKSENVTDALAREMLQYKILVLAQKDHYEGHYRLMDALLSGSLVLTDPMHPLPAGLRDGESIVVYSSMADLKRKIIHYLGRDEERRRIGRMGREIALKYHNPAAWVERIVFGNWSSTLGA